MLISQKKKKKHIQSKNLKTILLFLKLFKRVKILLKKSLSMQHCILFMRILKFNVSRQWNCFVQILVGIKIVVVYVAVTIKRRGIFHVAVRRILSQGMDFKLISTANLKKNTLRCHFGIYFLSKRRNLYYI